MYLHLAQTAVKSLHLQADACKQLCALYSALAAATASSTSISAKRASVVSAEQSPPMLHRKSAVGTTATASAAAATAARKTSRAAVPAAVAPAATATTSTATAAESIAVSSGDELDVDDNAAASGGSVTSLAYLKVVAQSRAVTYANMYHTCMAASDQ
jgi:predicted solute-binding protein